MKSFWISLGIFSIDVQQTAPSNSASESVRMHTAFQPLIFVLVIGIRFPGTQNGHISARSKTPELYDIKWSVDAASRQEKQTKLTKDRSGRANRLTAFTRHACLQRRIITTELPMENTSFSSRHSSQIHHTSFSCRPIVFQHVINHMRTTTNTRSSCRPSSPVLLQTHRTACQLTISVLRRRRQRRWRQMPNASRPTERYSIYLLRPSSTNGPALLSLPAHAHTHYAAAAAAAVAIIVGHLQYTQMHVTHSVTHAHWWLSLWRQRSVNLSAVISSWSTYKCCQTMQNVARVTRKAPAAWNRYELCSNGLMIQTTLSCAGNLCISCDSLCCICIYQGRIAMWEVGINWTG